MRRLSFGLIATLGIAACDSSVTNGMETTAPATSSSADDTSSTPRQEETSGSPGVDDGGAKPVPRSDAAAPPDYETEPN